MRFSPDYNIPVDCGAYSSRPRTTALEMSLRILKVGSASSRASVTVVISSGRKRVTKESLIGKNLHLLIIHKGILELMTSTFLVRSI